MAGTSTDETKMKTHDILLLVLFGMFSLFGLLAFFIQPKDVTIATKVVEAIGVLISDLLAFKFGIHQSQVPPGTSQFTKTVVPPVPDDSAVNIPPAPSVDPASNLQ